MKILIIHGPNLHRLGEREPEVYGRTTLVEIDEQLKKLAQELKVEISSVQSNHEGEIVQLLGEASKTYAAVVVNPAAYTHTSVAIRDAVAGAGIPVIEVHLSNIYGREEFRQKSLVAPVAAGQISGFGKDSYFLALRAAVSLLKKGQKKQ